VTEIGQETRDKTAGSSIFLNFLKLALAITCGLFVIFSVVFGPYDLKNALEAAMASAVIAVIVALPFLLWQWRKRRT
jgi:protein-S-isoprenylcysteine O-methyltransferase Ste14